jgi:hypothetical protein
MPSATPIPRGPGALILFGADDLLVVGACPACSYAAQADDRFLGWFALEGHAESETITRLCASLGTCPAHTRALLGQPGSDGRLTVVYRYVLRQAVSHLASGTAPKAPCPACSARAAAAARAVDAILAGLREDEAFGDRYRAAGGLCLPHLRLAAAHGPRRAVAWLAAEARVRLTAEPPGLTFIAGERDADAEIRVRLRAALPEAALSQRPGTVPSCGAADEDSLCAICRAAAVAERDAVDAAVAAPRKSDGPASAAAARGRPDGPASPAVPRGRPDGPASPAAPRGRPDGPVSGAAAGQSRPDDSLPSVLCAAHLHEACADSRGPSAGAMRLLAGHAELSAAWLSSRPIPHRCRDRRCHRPLQRSSTGNDKP